PGLHAPLRGDGADLALQAHALSRGAGDPIEDAGELPTRAPRHRDGDDEEVEVLRTCALGEEVQGLVERTTEAALTNDHGQLAAKGLGRLLGELLEGPLQGMPGA